MLSTFTFQAVCILSLILKVLRCAKLNNVSRIVSSAGNYQLLGTAPLVVCVASVLQSAKNNTRSQPLKRVSPSNIFAPPSICIVSLIHFFSWLTLLKTGPRVNKDKNSQIKNEKANNTLIYRVTQNVKVTAKLSLGDPVATQSPIMNNGKNSGSNDEEKVRELPTLSCDTPAQQYTATR